MQLATCLQPLLLLPSGSTWAFLPRPCSSWAALTKGWLWLQQRHWDLSISIQSWAHFEGNHCFGFPPLDSLRNFQIYIAVRGSPCPILPLFIFLLTGKDAHHALEFSLLNFTSFLFYALKTLRSKKLDVFYLHLSTCLPENSANTFPSNFVSLRARLFSHIPKDAHTSTLQLYVHMNVCILDEYTSAYFCVFPFKISCVYFYAYLFQNHSLPHRQSF